MKLLKLASACSIGLLSAQLTMAASSTYQIELIEQCAVAEQSESSLVLFGGEPIV